MSLVFAKIVARIAADSCIVSVHSPFHACKLYDQILFPHMYQLRFKIQKGKIETFCSFCGSIFVHFKFRLESMTINLIRALVFI